jgi:hypothetical protein
MKTSFSMKVTGSITVSIEPSNEDGGGAAAAAAADNCGSILVDVLLKSLVNDAVKKYVHNEGIAAEEEEEDEDLSSPLPKRRIPANADDSVEDEEEEDDDEEASVEEQDEEGDEDEDEAGDLPNVQIDYLYADDNSLSQKMYQMNLRRK